MKKIRIFATALLLAFTLSSCESFFDVELDDQAKIEDIFRQKTEVQKYLSHLYSYIPQEEEVVGMHGWTVGRSDEALFSWYQWVYYTQFRTGNYSSATTNFNYWPDYYIGINQCSIFLKYIDLDKEDTPTTVAYMKAEARFLRAYYYFLLFRQYGPVFIWGDQIADETIDAKSVDATPYSRTPTSWSGSSTQSRTTCRYAPTTSVSTANSGPAVLRAVQPWR